MEDGGKEDGSDKKILSAVINKTVIPRLTGIPGNCDSVRTLEIQEILCVLKSNRFQVGLVGKCLFVQMSAVIAVM